MPKYLKPNVFVRLQRFMIHGSFHRWMYGIDTGEPGNLATDQELMEHWTSKPDKERCGAAKFGRKYAMQPANIQ